MREWWGWGRGESMKEVGNCLICGANNRYKCRRTGSSLSPFRITLWVKMQAQA